MRKGNGGLIGPLNNPTATVASGMFSMDEQQQNLGARNWPGTPAATKPNPPSFANAASFTASISGSTMTVTAIAIGTLAVGQNISGAGVAQYTVITAQLTGSAGSTGTYTVSIGQTVSSGSMNATLSLTSVTATTSSVVVPFITGYDGGSPLTSVTANVYNGSTFVGTASGLSSPLTITGLPNSTVYSVTLTATNAIGTSSPSTGPYFQTASVPSVPTIGSASLVNGAVQVSFTPSSNNNGSTITSYTAVSSPGGITTSGTTSPITMSGLGYGVSYTFTVYATNAVGNSSSSSSSNSITTPTPSATGGVATTDGAYTVRTFTANDTLGIIGGSLTCDILVVAGGGAGGYNAGAQRSAGGGGAGGLIYQQNVIIPVGSYAVTIGTGGIPGQTYANKSVGNGTNTTVGSLYTAIGGGVGGGAFSPYSDGPAAGGSGGGSQQAGGNTGGAGLQPSQAGASGTYGFGNAGGSVPSYGAGGGGGAGGAGGGGPGGGGNYVGYNGGTGKSIGIKVAASPIYYAGGGGAGGDNSSGTGGTGGGGDPYPSVTNGTNGLGGGGGGTNTPSLGYGGTGIFIIRYLT